MNVGCRIGLHRYYAHSCGAVFRCGDCDKRWAHSGRPFVVANDYFGRILDVSVMECVVLALVALILFVALA